VPNDTTNYMTTVTYFGCPFCGRSQAINYALKKGEYMKIGEPHNLGTVQIRQAMGRAKGFKTISEEPAINLISDPAILQFLNAEIDMAGGILWGAWEQGLYDRLHPPLLIKKYSSVLDKMKANKKTEDALRLQIDDFRHDNLKLIETIKNERKICEQLGFDYEDAQKKISQLQGIIDQYENASLK